MLKNKYIKAEDKPQEDIINKVDLFANYAHEFDFHEDGILNWDEWNEQNVDYDPSKLKLDDDEIININEQLLRDELPMVENDLSQNDEFRKYIQDSMEKLTASAFIWDDDEDEIKKSTELITDTGKCSDDDVEITSDNCSDNDKTKNTTSTNDRVENNRNESSQKKNNDVNQKNKKSNINSEITGNLDVDEFNLFQITAHAEICSGLSDHAKSLNNALRSGKLNMSNIQAARLNVGGFYTAKMACWKMKPDDEIIKSFKILEFQSNSDKMKQQLTQRMIDSKQDLMKKKFIDKDE